MAHALDGVRVVKHEREDCRGLLTRIVRGPEPPIETPYTPALSLRCRFGLHLWARTWHYTRVANDALSVTFSLNQNRPHDYVACARCGELRG